MTACYLMGQESEPSVLLGYKKTGFGAGKYAGIGGKVEPGETVAQAAIREVEEEIGVVVMEEDLRFMGEVTFLFPFKEQWNQKVSIFLVERWSGVPHESEEMRPVWFKLDEIPYPLMWQDAGHWLPPVLSGVRICASFSFQADNETVADVSVSHI